MYGGGGSKEWAFICWKSFDLNLGDFCGQPHTHAGISPELCYHNFQDVIQLPSSEGKKLWCSQAAAFSENKWTFASNLWRECAETRDLHLLCKRSMNHREPRPLLRMESVSCLCKNVRTYFTHAHCTKKDTDIFPSLSSGRVAATCLHQI